MVNGYVAKIELSKICSSVVFLTEITLQEHDIHTFREFEKTIRNEKSMVECYQVSAAHDYLVRFLCTDINDYKEIADRLLEKTPIKSMKSHCVLSQVKHFSGYPLQYMLQEECE